jgi:hypothetical protein
MHVRIPAREIHDAWPDRLRDLFEARGVNLMPAGPPHTPESVRFAEPCSCRWDVATGDLVIDQG